MKVCVVDYGIGNVQSVVNACEQIGAETSRATDGDSLLASDADRIVLPGVGAIGAALQNLRERGLIPALEKRVFEDAVPFLGICVGMQVLGKVCEEFGTHQGLGWIPGTVSRLAPGDSGVRLPHVGWNTIEATDRDHLLMREISGKDAYFVHSYTLHCPEEFILAKTTYQGYSFASAVCREHVAGVQFHPEKSSLIGTALLAAFAGD